MMFKQVLFDDLESMLLQKLKIYYHFSPSFISFFLFSSFLSYFVNLKSNLAILNNKSHNLLTSAFHPKNVKLINFPLKKLNISLLKIYITFKLNVKILVKHLDIGAKYIIASSLNLLLCLSFSLVLYCLYCRPPMLVWQAGNKEQERQTNRALHSRRKP